MSDHRSSVPEPIPEPEGGVVDVGNGRHHLREDAEPQDRRVEPPGGQPVAGASWGAAQIRAAKVRARRMGLSRAPGSRRAFAASAAARGGHVDVPAGLGGAHRARSVWSLSGYRQQVALAVLVVAIIMVIVDVPGVDRAGLVPAVPGTGRGASPGASAAPDLPGLAAPGRPGPSRSAARSPTDSAPPSGDPGAPPGDKHPGDADRRRTGPAGSLRLSGSDAVALTFDDGPDAVQTPKLLDLLARNHVKATFCLVGPRVRALPDVVRRIAAEGHTLCNHSYENSNTLGEKSAEYILADLQETNRAIREVMPGARIDYFRAPGGKFTNRMVNVADGLGMKPIFWEVDPRDRDRPDGEGDEAHVKRVVKVVKDKTQPGSIVLSHDFGEPLTIVAYEQLLPLLKERFTLAALP
jgi:peptidoglycan/xylan/chitin deacetylase (PgdA/CDA1 family)